MTFDLHTAAEGFAQDFQDTLDIVLPPATDMPLKHRQLQVLESDNHRVVRPGTREKPAVLPAAIFFLVLKPHLGQRRRRPPGRGTRSRASSAQH